MLQVDQDFIGVFATATDSSLIISPDIIKGDIDTLKDELDIQNTYIGNVGKSSTIGALTTGNSIGILVPREISDNTIKKIKESININILKIQSKLNAVGNLVLVNDNAALVTPRFSEKTIKNIEETLSVKAHKGTIAGLNTVGSVAIATNKGVLVHPEATEEEIKMLEEIFNVKIFTGTVNYGSPFIGNGILANSNGYIVGKKTTGPELGRIEEALAYS